ncbi:glycosyltransferase family 2 protein [Methylovulum psychrotolerans]|uniref:Glycosyl transferase family 2 n=1 Tax=Methylovulum psychrotolerans TaxID=1704499 RepID=A0A1Z4BU97_9GAMM|nr:glycosyltransferase [Methylovulum psychrotolerans]ASF44891.1 glycosyl transferase family 2 [Methylovulum psychrotolerans]
MNTPSVSVVVIGRNEGQRLAECLASIQAISPIGGPIEVIYADSNSQDGSSELAASYGAKVLRVIPARPCAAIGRNAGWRAASAPLVLFLDGDTRLHPDFLPAALQALAEQPEVAIVWGHRRERYPERTFYNRVLDLDWIYAPGITDFCGGDALMRRSVLVATNGFSEDLIAGEEPELCQRIRALGHTILHIDQPMTDHDLAMSRWQAYWKRALRAGHAYAEVSQRLKNTGFPLWASECKRNAIHAGVLLAMPLAALALAVLMGDVLPLLGLLLAYLFLIVRSAYKARWKCRQPVTLLLYGLHSHLQQIPIALGQMGYWYNRLRNRRQGLIEYK